MTEEEKVVTMDVKAHLDDDRIPFVRCQHDDDGVWPANVLTSKTTVLVTCTKCGKVFPHSSVEWLTPEIAAKRYGWVLKPTDTPQA